MTTRKQRIESLEWYKDDLYHITDVLTQRIRELKDKVWELENPPEFKVMDKFRITNVADTATYDAVVLRVNRNTTISDNMWDYTMLRIDTQNEITVGQFRLQKARYLGNVLDDKK